MIAGVAFWGVVTLATWIGWRLVRRGDWGPWQTGLGGAVLILSLSCGLGLGLCSLLVPLALFIHPTDPPIFWLETALALGLIAWDRQDLLPRLPSLRRPVTPASIWLWSVCGLSLVLTAVSLSALSQLAPFGGWDATMIWTHHARYLFLGEEHWQRLFSPTLLWWYENDYPLLLPALIARGWTAVGEAVSWVPQALGHLWVWLTLGALGGALASWRGASAAAVGVLLLTGSNRFAYEGTQQYADIPLAFYFLASWIALLRAAQSQAPNTMLLLCGVFAGLSAWTKNEGLLFCLALAGSVWVGTAKQQGWQWAARHTGFLVAGMLPGLLMVAWLKTHLAPTSHLLLAPRESPVSALLLDGQRWAMIGETFVQYFLTVDPALFCPAWMVLLYALLPKQSPAWIPSVIRFSGWGVWGTYLLGCLVVYLLSPYPLVWHQTHSQGRLLMQVWPCLILLGMAWVQLPDSPVIAGDRSIQPGQTPNSSTIT